MAPTIRSDNDAYSVWADTHSITYPASISSGDVLVLVCWNYGNDATPATISGWTRVYNSGLMVYSYFFVEVFVREADGTESGSFTYDPGGSPALNYYIAALDGADAASFVIGTIYGTDAASYDDSTPDSPSCDISGLSDPIVFRFCGYENEAQAPTAPSGSTLVATPEGDSGMGVATDDDNSAESISNGWSFGGGAGRVGSNTFAFDAASSATVPAAVSDLAASISGTTATLTWSAPSDGGAAISDYIVQYRVKP